MADNILWIIAAFIAPMLICAVCSVFYFIVFPKAFDRSLAAISELVKVSDINEKQYIYMVIVQSVTMLPIINAFFAIFEEAGWRGYFYPLLRKSFGIKKAVILGGIFSGVWLMPLVILGFFYGANPAIGIIAIILYSFSVGALMDFVYRKTQSIWICAIARGGLNAAFTLPQMFIIPEKTNPILGPAYGIVFILPMLIAAIAILYFKKE